MWNEDSYISEIKYYVSPDEFNWLKSGASTVQNIDNDYAEYEGNVELGSTLNENYFILPAPPAAFNQLNVTPAFSIKDGEFPSPCGWAEVFNPANIAAAFTSDGDFPYPIGAQPIMGIDYNNIYTVFKMKEDYDFCYPSYAIPKSFDYDGICGLMVQGKQFHGLPTPWMRPFPKSQELPDWKRLDPEFIGNTTLETTVSFPNNDSTSITFEVKDRDINREEYSQFVEKYWESQS